jgi:hypothetical protein
VISSWRYLGTAVGFGFGAIWMTVGVGAAILVLLCAALGFGIAFIAERERAGFARGRPASATDEIDEPSLVDDFELDHFERRDAEPVAEESSGREMVSVAAEPDYGWPHS